MTDNVKCWKIVATSDRGVQSLLRVGENTFSPQFADEEEKAEGLRLLTEWHVERLYEVQVCGPDAPRGYLDRRVEVQDIAFDELIFSGGKCIGIYHEECIMLFDDETTHRQEKWIGEFITGPDRTHDAYDYYYLVKS